MMRAIAATLALAFFLAACGESETPVTFEGPSTDLRRTVVVATLDQPIPEGKNAIWCASFAASWKELMEFVGEPIDLSDDAPVADALNAAPDPRPAIPADSLYTAAGRARDGVLAKVRTDMAEKFPDASLSILPELGDGGIIAYAYLRAEVPFGIPYFQHDAPLAFKEQYGNIVNVTSFGIRERDQDAYLKLRKQGLAIPIVEAPDNATNSRVVPTPIEYAIDLDVMSYPNQLIVAKVTREESLKACVEKVEAKIMELKERTIDESLYGLGTYDTLFVPDIVIDISHRFSELEGRTPTNTKLQNMPFYRAIQEVDFRLTRSGAELRSEAAQQLLGMDGPDNYVFDRPFLVYMKKRGADQPYFAMWVANAELLSPWKN